MDQSVVKTQIDQVLKDLELDEHSYTDPRKEMVATPFCVFDCETYTLLAKQSGDPGYPVVFSRAIRWMRDEIDEDQIHRIIGVIKLRRSKGRHKNVRTKIRKDELDWVEETAIRFETQPARILEAIAFVFLRIGSSRPGQ